MIVGCIVGGGLFAGGLFTGGATLGRGVAAGRVGVATGVTPVFAEFTGTTAFEFAGMAEF